MITLNTAEQRLAKFVAKERHRHNRLNGITNRRMGPQSDEQTDLEGMAAEIAFAKYVNVYPDLDVDCDEYLTHDAVLHDGTRVDVKSTRYPNGRLIVVPWKDVDAVDAYVLVVGTFPSYRIAGAIESYRLIRPHRMKDLGHGKVFVATQDELKPIHQL
jgi:sporulation protein YlmC with PRC-barrel domain